ncbi:hypothetical protein GALMADRAFT_245913 [Galerina marginata CBS 339.88]|uniref:pyranose dehydrogenase (acceptor) n=1 Tax=Galerina marginata (strain CBS 339.88) TaxID=685588 RepID=A0A067T3U0_GALM3|nr:hypothetical protein GALMADRAFT_245913 [Galerina marginata CBS 339.88]
MPRSSLKTVTTVFLASSVYFGLAQGIILNSLDSLKANYDYIIVGGGTAGNVVANRLTEDHAVKVLLLEAGASDTGVLEIEIPFLCTRAAPQTPWDWNYTTVPQPGLNGVSIPYPRGYVLGGTSSVNCMVYTRGSKADFDRYARVTGDKGWSWQNMFPYFKKSEKFTPPSDGHNTTGEFNPSVHGFDGFHSVSLPGAPTVIDNRFNLALEQLHGEFIPNLDDNSGSPLGFGWSQSGIDGPSGTRSSSAAGYLATSIRNRSNLHILLNAQVSRLLPTGNEKGVPIFRKVEFRVDREGPLRTVTASREVIVSAGSINTPQILLNSGIGNAGRLKSLGIPSLIDLSDVGENLSDHPLTVLAWFVNSNETYDAYYRNSTLQAEEIQTWESTREGAFVNGIAQHIGFVRVPDNSSIFHSSPNPSSGPNSPHFEIFVSNYLLGNTPPTGNFLSISAILLTPGSSARGSVKINSTNSFDVPIIDAGLLTDKTDVPLLREAVRSILRLSSAPAWSDYIIGPANLSQPTITSSDAEIDAFLRANTGSAYHVVGTSSMSPKGMKTGVVDPDLRLKKAIGVRIVDASVLPFVPAGHTQAPTYAIAERAADLIKAANLVSS